MGSGLPGRIWWRNTLTRFRLSSGFIGVSNVSLFDEPYYIQINEARWAMAERVLREIRDECGVVLTSCLDVGCGPGWFSQRLATFGLNVVGVDGRRENIEAAKQRMPGVRFHIANIESEEDTAVLSPADLVFCFGFLYHVENPFLVIRTLRRLARKVLFIESIIIPGEAPFAWLVDENPNETQGLTHYSLIPSRTCLLKMLRCAGFEYVYEYLGYVDHQDFQETATRHRRRRIFLASSSTLTMDHLESVPQTVTPKYDFAKK